jgi:receptor protein-tyrosine kinase
MSTIEKAVAAQEKAARRKTSDPVETLGDAVLPDLQDSSVDMLAEHAEPFEHSPGFEQPPTPALHPAPESLLQDSHEVEGGANESHATVEIPFAEFEAIGMITPSSPRSQIAEEFRAIKRPLLMNIAGEGASQVDNANLIMVTSALAGDGKTFCALNLALSIAMEQDKTVLFIDSDISQATGGKLMNVPPGCPGLTDLLEHKGLQVQDVMLRTNISNLRIIPAGNVHERSTELLASKAMADLMKELSKRYPDRVVVFDSPPLLMTSEAGVLTNSVGQIVFVVAAESTPQSAVTSAIAKINSDKVVGMVLNKFKHYRGSRYSYGYGYGYGSRQQEA